jgi:putative membrane protein
MTLTQWLVSTISIILTTLLVPGANITFIGAILLAVVLAIINLFMRPFIILLTLPINILTLGLFSLVINAFLIMFSSWVVPGFHIGGFWSAMVFAIVLALINALFGMGMKRDVK